MNLGKQVSFNNDLREELKDAYAINDHIITVPIEEHISRNQPYSNINDKKNRFKTNEIPKSVNSSV